MSYINNTSIILKLSMVLGSAIMLFGAQQAAAIPTGPLSCAGVFGVGGCAPYGQVIFGTGGNNGSLFEYDSAVLDYSVTGPSATVRGVVDLANGTLKAFASGIEDGNPSTGSGGYIIANATDVFTLHGSSASGFATFTVVLTADGVGSIANSGYSGQVSVQLGVPGGGGGDFDIGVYQAGNNAPLGASFSLLSTLQGSQGNELMASDTHSVLLNNPFSLGYSLRADVTQGTTFDLLNTGHLGFILPAGVSITSMGGYNTGGPTSVPEPATFYLMLLGLLLVAAYSRTAQRSQALDRLAYSGLRSRPSR